VLGIRARIAENVATSRAKIPDATCSVVVDCRRLLDLRTRFSETLRQRGDDTAVTPFALVCRMLVEALRANPDLNATWVDEGPAIRTHQHLHLGIGTATDRGLLVPVVRDADRRTTRELAAEITRLANGARTASLAPSELTGSTFTVSNFGALGLDEGIPVINHPEAAILGVGSIKARPHVIDGEVVACPTATLTLAFDHRVADGAEAGRLLSTLRALVEAPELALIDR
jgi:pyruvate dehydrogenase E2 component (dihydrolipoamide acetyltransferase)